ncbi:MAG: RNA methyltransferase, partial [Candidatus Aminicenantes bacterium]|nr:RNA methyltransferase [Candidatus Aminicenantes bacterium]
MKKRTTVILARPEKRENIGLVARNMKNTGFENLRLVNVKRIDQKSYVIAVHAQEILDNIRFCKDMTDATRDIDVIFAATSRKRKNFLALSLRDAVQKIFSFPPQTKVGLLFGNERTGLTSEELLSSNYRFIIPQVSKQPSYNLASAVLLTLFHIYASDDLK